MNDYTVMHRRFKEFRNGKSVFEVVIIVDTVSDLPNPSDEWDAGSICLVAEDHDYRILNNKGAWV